MGPILRESNLKSYGKFDQFPLYSYLFFWEDFSLKMPRTNTSPENWDAWKTILFFLGLLLLVPGVASKGVSRLRPRLFVGMILILIFAEATEGELKSIELEDLWWIFCCPQKSMEMFEDLCWKKWDKFHLLSNVYLYSIYTSFPTNVSPIGFGKVNF